jgi:multimeric flavodoxin WrbA
MIKMAVIGINGSPRKTWNTATLVSEALKGAASQGAETELINLYDIDFKGCTSCFACKLKGGKSYGKCAYDDDLAPVLGKMENAYAIILGSPIYLGSVTGEIRSFLERLIFPYLVYDASRSTLFPRRIPVGFIYTMGMEEGLMRKVGYPEHLRVTEMVVERIIGDSESLFVTDTYQFDDYSKYVSSAFDAEEKAKRRREIFPQDCRKAFQMGARLVKGNG